MSPIEIVQNRLCGFTAAHRLQRVQAEALQKYTDCIVSEHTSSKPAPHARKFTKPLCVQQESRFYKLPTELRLMVFRNLLQNNKPLDWDSSIDKPNFSFEPNVLLVCQAWYTEAAPILYRENTFIVFFKPDNGYPVGFLRSLYPADCGNGGFGLGSRFPSGIERYGTKFLVRLWLYPFHQRYANKARAFKLLPVFCRAVTNLLLGSEVSLQLWSRDGNYSIEAFEAFSCWIPALRVLRCKSIQVLSPTASGPIFYMGLVWERDDLLMVDKILEEVVALTREITSASNPVDPYMQLFVASRALTRLRMSLSEEGDKRWIDNQITALETLVAEQSCGGFEDLWKQLQVLTDANERDIEMSNVRKHKFCSFKMRLN